MSKNNIFKKTKIRRPLEKDIASPKGTFLNIW
jgi:hypothetical protein